MRSAAPLRPLALEAQASSEGVPEPADAAPRAEDRAAGLLGHDRPSAAAVFAARASKSNLLRRSSAATRSLYSASDAGS